MSRSLDNINSKITGEFYRIAEKTWGAGWEDTFGDRVFHIWFESKDLTEEEFQKYKEGHVDNFRNGKSSGKHLRAILVVERDLKRRASCEYCGR